MRRRRSKPSAARISARSPATALPAAWKSGPPAGLRRCFTSRASAWTSPPALSTAVKPSPRAALAVASPTASTPMSRRGESSAKARAPLALVKSSACTPARSLARSAAASGRGRIASSGSITVATPRAASASAKGRASSSGRVIRAVSGMKMEPRDSTKAAGVRPFLLEKARLLPYHGKSGAGRGAQSFAHGTAQVHRLGAGAPLLRAMHLAAVGQRDEGAQPQDPTRLMLGQCRDRRAAGAVEHRQAGALGRHLLRGGARRSAAPASAAMRSSSARISTPMAPWADRRQHLLRRRIAVALSARPSRFRPASASRVASTSPAASLASRVSTLPRKS